MFISPLFKKFYGFSPTVIVFIINIKSKDSFIFNFKIGNTETVTLSNTDGHVAPPGASDAVV